MYLFHMQAVNHQVLPHPRLHPPCKILQEFSTAICQYLYSRHKSRNKHFIHTTTLWENNTRHRRAQHSIQRACSHFRETCGSLEWTETLSNQAWWIQIEINLKWLETHALDFADFTQIVQGYTRLAHTFMRTDEDWVQTVTVRLDKILFPLLDQKGRQGLVAWTHDRPRLHLLQNCRFQLLLSFVHSYSSYSHRTIHFIPLPTKSSQLISRIQPTTNFSNAANFQMCSSHFLIRIQWGRATPIPLSQWMA